MEETKKSSIIIFATVGGILGFSTHFVLHHSSGVDLLSRGPHAIQGIIYTLVGTLIGGMLYLIISQR